MTATLTPRRLSLQRWGLLLAALLSLSLLVSACSDSDDDNDDADQTIGAQADNGDGGDSDDDDGDAFTLLSPTELRSYRYRMSMEAETAGGEDTGFDLNLNVQSEGAFVAPDRSSSTTVMDLGLLALTVETVQIGTDSWSRTDNGPWEQQGQADDLSGLSDFDVEVSPALFFGEDEERAEASITELSRRLGELDGTPDTVNGISATRYELTSTEFATIFGVEDELDNAAANGTTTIWIADDSKFPVRMELVSTTEEDGQQSTVTIVLEFFDLDADDIVIEPPI